MKRQSTSTSTWYTLPSHLTVIARIGCGLRKEKVGNDRNGRSEKKKIWIGKIEAKKKSLVKCIFVRRYTEHVGYSDVYTLCKNVATLENHCTRTAQ